MFSLDLSMEFSTVNHDILLKKLEHCGIRAKLMCLVWLGNYLNDRTQCVHYNESTSGMLAINCGAHKALY